MSDDDKLAGDRALLARLNALKNSTVDLDSKKPKYQPSADLSLPVASSLACALHQDLASRYGIISCQTEATAPAGTLAENNSAELLRDEDGKTVEDLLAELGPEHTWNVHKHEEEEIQDLIKVAQEALSLATTREKTTSIGNKTYDFCSTHNESTGIRSHSVEEPEQILVPTEEELDAEADEYLAQILEQIESAPKCETAESKQDHSNDSDQLSRNAPESGKQATQGFPSPPSEDLEPPTYSDVTADDALATRFANLGLPSVPTTMKSASTQPPAKTQSKGYTDEEIDLWCFICNDDASLRCTGCDGDLYCTKCWLEGHRSADAGYEERSHKAIEFGKSHARKAQPARRLVGA